MIGPIKIDSVLQDSLFKRKIQFISLDLPYYDDPKINKLISLTLLFKATKNTFYIVFVR